VLEAQYFRGQAPDAARHLFELDQVTVDDVMTPRHQIHGIDIATKPAQLRQQLATSLPHAHAVYEDSLDTIVGIVHIKQIVALAQAGRSTPRPEPLLRPPYFVPAVRRLLTQLTQFQADRPALGLVVDEYGELQAW